MYERLFLQAFMNAKVYHFSRNYLSSTFIFTYINIILICYKSILTFCKRNFTCNYIISDTTSSNRQITENNGIQSRSSGLCFIADHLYTYRNYYIYYSSRHVCIFVAAEI